MKRYTMKVAYDGSKFFGWQVQPQGITVQQCLQDTLSLIAKQPIVVMGAGRTDTGVHALGQVAHFDFPDNMTTRQLLLAVNSRIPHSVQVLQINETTPDFHARYDAISRTYQYVITLTKTPFNVDYKAWLPRYKLDVDSMRACIPFFLGKHDFTSFAKPNPKVPNRVCEIKEMSIEFAEDIVIKVIADRFLHNMVRRIVGAMIAVSHKGLPASVVSEWIATKRHEQKNYITAPANGLYLVEVGYGNGI